MIAPVRFRVAHRLERRLRIVAPALAGETERCYIVEILLRKRPPVKAVKSAPEIGSFTIHYDPAALPEAQLLAQLDTLLGHVAAAPAPRPQPAAVDANQPLRECQAAVEGMTCASCALLIEMRLKRDPRVREARVNYASGTASVIGHVTREEVFRLIDALGYRAAPMDTIAQRRMVVERERMELERARRRFLTAAALSAPVMALGMLMHRQPLLRLVEWLLTTQVVFGSGSEIFRKAWALAKQRSANMDSLIALGAGAAYFYSLPGLLRRHHHVYFESAAGIVTFVLLGRWLEERAKGRASAAIRKLIELQPQTAQVVRDGVEMTVPIDEIAVGDVLRVRPGERVPIDGVIIEGTSDIDEALVTGESLPVTRRAGEKVIGGCINGNGGFLMRATVVNGETVLAGIVRLVDHAQSTRLPVQKMADRISARFVPAVGGIAGLTFAGWLAAGHPASRALAHAVAVLLIACPCALGLATPTAIMVGTGQAARRGIYIRNGAALETSAKLTTLVFDKTGTVTEGKPAVTDFINASSMTDSGLLALAVAAELPSEHFLARAVVAYGTLRGIRASASDGFEAIPGQGVRAKCDDIWVLVGNASLMESACIPSSALQAQADAFAEQGKTPVFLAVNGHLAGLLAIADRPRAGGREAIALLHRLGLETVMATGDVEAAAKRIARELGIDHVVARAAPAQKLELVRALQAQGRKVGMVGDGINDAPALSAADVGFAIGGGADIALESADVTLVGGDITRVAAAIDLSRRTMRVIRQNLFWALGYNTVAIPFAAAGRLTPMIASAAMAMSSISVVKNSLRLQREDRRA